MSYDLHINNLRRKRRDGTIFKIFYTLESYSKGHSVSKSGELEISGSSSDSNFIRFNQITPEIARGWVYDNVDLNPIIAELNSSLSLLLDGTYTKGIPENFHRTGSLPSLAISVRKVKKTEE
jgi:hypothetical protein